LDPVYTQSQVCQQARFQKIVDQPNPFQSQASPIQRKKKEIFLQSSSINKELRRLSRIPTIRNMRHKVRTIKANGVASRTPRLEVLNVIGLLRLEGVAKGDSANDLPRRELSGSIVHDHGALRVSAQHDLGIGALLQSLFDERGHFGTAGCAELGVSLWTVRRGSFFWW
jgi:hypothetical protein